VKSAAARSLAASKGMGVMLYQSAEQVEGPLNIRQSKRLNRREVVGGLALAGAASLFGLGPKGAGAESTRRQNTLSRTSWI
jgi:hypothetical protein